MRTLIAYATEEGQTEKIAIRIADQLAQGAFPCDRFNIADDRRDPVALDTYDAVIIGSPIHYSHYDRRLADYLKEYQCVLADMPSAFFSVSLGILSDEESEKDDVRTLTDQYLAEAGWTPALKTHFGGALLYSKYGWLKRWMMKLIAKKGGGPTDVRFDYEFTSWDKVDEFVEQFVALVESCKQSDEQVSQRSIYSNPTRRYSLRNRQSSQV